MLKWTACTVGYPFNEVQDRRLEAGLVRRPFGQLLTGQFLQHILQNVPYPHDQPASLSGKEVNLPA